MSEREEEPDLGVGDDQLPPDLRPGEDNPLAGGLEPGERAGDLLHEGRHAAEDEDPDADGEGEGEEKSAYGSGTDA